MTARNNRNILECKFKYGAGSAKTGIEIIETYWNVNKAVTSVPMPTVAEIIETYWNVNSVVCRTVMAVLLK